MKKILFVLLLISIGLVNAEWRINESFEGESFSEGWTIVNNDQDSHQWAIEQNNAAHFGIQNARVFSNSEENDDWIITPQITIQPGEVFKFWAASGTEASAEFVVRISTSGNSPADFDTYLGPTESIGEGYTEFSYNLALYTGQTVYIGIQCVSTNMLKMFVDDVKLGSPEANDLSIVRFQADRETYTSIESIELTTYIENCGTDNQTATITYFAEDTEIHSETVTVNAGQELVVMHETDAFMGLENLTASLSADDDITNNEQSTQVIVMSLDSLVEDFEGDTFPAEYWGLESILGLDWTVTQWGTYQGNGTGYLARATDANWNYLTSKSRMITPVLNIVDGDSLSFVAKNWDNSSVDYIHIEYSENGSDFTLLESVQLNEEYQYYSVDLSSIAGIYYIGITGETSATNYGYCYIDNIRGPLRYFGEAAEMEVDPESIDFGQLYVHESLTDQVSITNIGVEDLIINSVEIVGAQAQAFTCSLLEDSSIFPITLTQLQEYNFTVTYSPLTGGTSAAELLFNTNTGANESLPLQGSAEDVTLYAPFFEDFSTMLPSNWYGRTGLLTENTQLIDEEIEWIADGFSNMGTEGSARISTFGENLADWMITPPIDLGDTNNQYQLEFDISMTDWFGQNPVALSEDDKIHIVLNDGSGWSESNILLTFDSNLFISPVGTHINLPLASYTGIIQIGFYAESTVINPFVNAYIDNFAIRTAPQEPELTYSTQALAFGSVSSLEPSSSQFVEIINTGAAGLEITDISLSGSNPDDFVYTTSNELPVTLGMGRRFYVFVQSYSQTAGYKSADLTIEDNLADNDLVVELTADVIDTSISEFPWSFGFEDGFFPLGWKNDDNQWSVLAGSTTAAEGVYTASVSYIHYTDAILRSPAIILPENEPKQMHFKWIDNDMEYFRNRIAQHDTTFCEISVDGGQTWETQAFLSAAEPMSAYAEQIIDLQAYAGETIYVRWRDETDNTTNAYGAAVDDIYITDRVASPVFDIDLDVFDFGYVLNGAISEPIIATISNIGDDNLVINEIELAGNHASHFSFEEPVLPAIITPNNNIQIMMFFEPTQDRLKEAYLSISDNANRIERQIPVRGVSYELAAPRNLTVDPINEDTAALLTWEAPSGSGMDSEDFEGYEFPPAGWTLQEVNNTYTWMQGPPPGSSIGSHTGDYCAGLVWTTTHQDEWLILEDVLVTGDLEFWSYAMQGSENGDHYTVKISQDNGQTWTTLLDLSEMEAYGYDNENNPIFNEWDTPYQVDLSQYLNENVDIAWNAYDTEGTGLWSVWFIDDVKIGNSRPASTFRQNQLPSVSGYKIYRNDNLIAETDTPEIRTYTDDFERPQAFEYYLTAVYDNNDSAPSNAVEVMLTDINDITPLATGLYKNYPNPFNPETSIRYSMENDGHVIIDIYNVKGQKVKSLVNDNVKQGSHTVIWNGRDSKGKAVSSGMYFYKMKTGNYSHTEKMLLMK